MATIPHNSGDDGDSKGHDSHEGNVNVQSSRMRPSSVVAAAAAAGSSTTSSSNTSVRLLKRQLRKQMATTLALIPPSALAAQSSQVTSRILASPTFHAAKRVCVYVNTDTSEVQTGEICKSILSSPHAQQEGSSSGGGEKKELYVPRFATKAGSEGKFELDMKMLRIRDWQDFQAMVRNRWGIREPEIEGRQDGEKGGNTKKSHSFYFHRADQILHSALDESTGGQGLDLILAPGVAFDDRGGRLGHGKGYYDRYLARADAFARRTGGSAPVSVALSLTEQILPSSERVPADDDDQMLDAIIHPDGVIHGTAKRWQEGIA